MPRLREVQVAEEIPELMELRDAALSGDPRAVRDFVRRIQPLVWGFLARRMRSTPDWVDDLASETLAKVVANLHTCRAEAEAVLVAWITRIARNALNDFRRSRNYAESRRLLSTELERLASEYLRSDRGENKKPQLRPLTSDWLVEPEPEAEPRDPGAAIVLPILEQTYTGLPEERQEEIAARLLLDRSWADIAREHGTTPSGAKRRYQRAIARLSREVLRQVEDLPEEERRLALEYLGQV